MLLIFGFPLFRLSYFGRIFPYIEYVRTIFSIFWDVDPVANFIILLFQKSTVFR